MSGKIITATLIILAITVLILGTTSVVQVRALSNTIDRVKVLEEKVDLLRANVALFYEVNKEAVEKKNAEKGDQTNDNSSKP